jgi:hypothetical protein
MESKSLDTRKQLDELNESKDSLGLKVGTIGVLVGAIGALLIAYGPQPIGKVIFGLGALCVFFGFLFTFAVVIRKWCSG